MDVDTDNDHGQAMDGDFRGTNDNCNSDSNNDPIETNVIDDKDLDSDSAQDENLLMVPPDQESPSHILMALNDHCLYETFKRLHYLDLLNVVKVCKRFETQGKEAFASKYKEIDLDECDQNKMENILSIFGSSIRSLRIYSNKNAADGDLFRAVIKNCSTKLKELFLIDFNIQLDSPKFRLPFSELEKLALGDCVGNLNLAHLIDECPNLKQILVLQCNLPGLNEMINRQFQKLEELQIGICDFDFDTDALEHFIVSNPALIKLAIHPTKIGTTKIGTSNAYRLIGQTMLKLQELRLYLIIDDLQHFQSDVGYIAQLRSLKDLGLNFNGLEVTPLMNALATNNVPIEILSILRGSIDDIAIKCISQLKRITSLNLIGVNGLNEEHVINLGRNLTDLQFMVLFRVKNEDGSDVLTIDALMQMLHYAKKLSCLGLFLNDGTDFIINVDNYKIMMETIQNRAEKTGLCLDIKGKMCKLDVPEAMLLANADVFSIEMNKE